MVNQIDPIAYALAFSLVGKQAMTKRGGVREEELDATGTRTGWGRDVASKLRLEVHAVAD